MDEVEKNRIDKVHIYLPAEDEEAPAADKE